MRGIHESLELTGFCSTDGQDIAFRLAHTTEEKINFCDSLKHMIKRQNYLFMPSQLLYHKLSVFYRIGNVAKWDP